MNLKALLLSAAAVVCVSPAFAQINFAFIGIGTPSYDGSTLDQATNFYTGTNNYIVSSIGAGDDSGLASNDTSITLTPGTFAISTDASVTQTWAGGFTAVFDSTEYVNRDASNALTAIFSGVLNGGSFTDTPVYLELTANQVGGPSNTVSYSFTETSTNPSVPEPSTWAMMGLGFAGLAFAGYRTRRTTTRAIA